MCEPRGAGDAIGCVSPTPQLSRIAAWQHVWRWVFCSTAARFSGIGEQPLARRAYARGYKPLNQLSHNNILFPLPLHAINDGEGSIAPGCNA